jgi:hypothetical protein
MTTINGITYIKEHSPEDSCQGCVGYSNSDLCDKLSDIGCHYAIYVELPKGTYKGLNVNIVQQYIEGKTVEFSKDLGTSWETVINYEKALNVYRVSNPDYLFRVKKEITERYMTILPNSGSVERAKHQNMKVTYSNNKPIKVELLGE